MHLGSLCHLPAWLTASQVSLLLAFILTDVNLGSLALGGEGKLRARVHNPLRLWDDTFDSEVEKKVETNDKHGIVDLSCLIAVSKQVLVNWKCYHDRIEDIQIGSSRTTRSIKPLLQIWNVDLPDSEVHHTLDRDIVHLARVLERRVEVNLVENDAEFNGEVEIIRKVAINLNFQGPIIHIVEGDWVRIVEERYDGVCGNP